MGFVIDESRSINEQEWITVLNFVKMIAAAIKLSPTEGHAAVVAFDHDSRHPITFNQFQTLNGFENAVDMLNQTGRGTRIGNALELARDEMFQASNGMRTDPNVGHFLILVTDGDDANTNYTRWREEFAALDIIVIAIGVGTSAIMQNLATLTPNNNYRAANFDILLSPEFRARIRLCRGN